MKEFSCDEGFILVDSIVRNCLPNGTRDGQETKCKAITNIQRWILHYYAGIQNYFSVAFFFFDIKLNFLILLLFFFVLLYLSKRLRPTFSSLQWLLHWSRYKISKHDIFLLRCRVHHDWFTNKEVQARWLLERKCNLLQR